jgi:hypothetical protein
MSIWQVIVLFAMAGCAIGCLLIIYKAIWKLTKAVSSIGSELTKINSKLERIEAVNGEDTSLQAMEAAISNFEKLKRVEAAKP